MRKMSALLAVTAFVRVPLELYDASRQDFTGGSGGVLLTLLGAGGLLFLVLTFGVAWLPARVRNVTEAVLVGLAVYAWARAGLFPGPSVNLDGGRVAADLSTGLAGLLAPLTGGLLLAWLGGRQPRIVTTILAVLLGGSIVQSAGAAVSSWRPGPPASDTAIATLLEWSREENVLIVVLDTLQSRVFEEVLEAEPALREELDGFRFYRSASSPSPTTYLSLPAIHSGQRYDPTQSARQYYRESIRDGSVLNRLVSAGYQVSYAMAMGPCPVAVGSCLGTRGLALSRREIAIKEASGSVQRLKELVSDTPLDVLCGEDALTRVALSVGAVGVVGVAANVMPNEVAELIRCSGPEGDSERARELDELLAPLFRDLFIETNPVPVKTALALLGYGRADVRGPLAPLEELIDQRG